jgi:hypothetical protein
MTRHDIQTRVPCGVCLRTILRWFPLNGQWVTDCGHTEQAILAMSEVNARVEFGQYAESEAG